MGVAGNLLAGRYRLDEPIGAGGFSEVWRATDAVLARPVAVKLLHPGYARQPEALGRLRAEARHAAALWHENIAHVYDYDEPAGGLQPYLVMELVDGPCLAGVLAGGLLDAGQAMDIVAQTAAGLRAAHAIGLIHRDIKPGNLLLAPDGAVKITDFGISRAIGSVPVTVTGVVMGTAGYLAPERISGAQATPASDLYALGIVAYECLAGTPPFAGEPLDVACAHRECPVPPLPAPVPAEVSALVMRLVAKDPALRPGSAEVAHRAGRLRDDLRDGLSAGAGRTRYLLAAPAPAAVPPTAPLIAPLIAPAGPAAEAWRPFPAAPRPRPRPRPRARTGARRRLRRPVPVLAPAAIAAFTTMVLGATVGAALLRHPADTLPAAPPAHPASGTAAALPARQPSSASPGHKPPSRTSPGSAGTRQKDASDHRTGTAPENGREKIRRHQHGKNASHGKGNGNGKSKGNGKGQGNGKGSGKALALSILSHKFSREWKGSSEACTASDAIGLLRAAWTPRGGRSCASRRKACWRVTSSPWTWSSSSACTCCLSWRSRPGGSTSSV